MRTPQLFIFLSILLCSTFATATFTSAQTRVDVGVGLGYTIAHTSFSQLPGFSSCSPLFEGGAGWGAALGAGIDIPMSSSIFGSVRVGYGNRTHTLSTEERVDIIVGSALTQATIMHTLALPLREYGLETSVGWRRGNLVLRAGAGYMLRSFGTMQAQEELRNPPGTVFSDSKSTIRNAISGDLPAAITSSWNLVGAVGLDIPLARGSRWRLTPEASLHVGLNSATSISSWKIIVPGFALRLSYEFPARQTTVEPVVAPAQPVKVIAARIAEPVVEKKTVLLPSKKIVKQRIVIEEIEEERFMPILPYIFFEKNSASIPARYARTRGSLNSDSVMSTIAFHHQLAEVVAERMKMDPAARIVLTGHCSADEQDGRIALQRANAVATLLVDSFGVDAKRITTKWRRLPANLSRATGDEAALADEENRRVEISSASPSLLLPYRVGYTVMNVKNLDAGASIGSSDSVIVIADTVRLVEKRRTMVQDSVVERFDLIVFPFGKTDLSEEHRRVVRIVKSRIGQNARVIVEGSTDPLGPADENAKLSLQRAQNVAAELQGAITVIGKGEAPYDPSRLLPEERMFQRVVSIYALVPRAK